MAKKLNHKRVARKQQLAQARRDNHYFLWNDHLGTNRGGYLTRNAAGRLGRNASRVA